MTTALRSAFPELLVLDLDRAQAFVAGAADVCISIRSPSAAPAQLSPNFRAVLRLFFHDLAGFDLPYPAGAVPFTREMAEQVVAFAERHRDAKRLVVHCEAGISRSVAVAIALSVCFAGRWWFPTWYRAEWRHDRYIRYRAVYEAICEARQRQEVAHG